MKNYKVKYQFNVLDQGIKYEERYVFISSDKSDEFSLHQIAVTKIIEVEEASKDKFKVGIISQVLE